MMKTTAGRGQLHVYLDYEKKVEEIWLQRFFCTSSIQ